MFVLTGAIELKNNHSFDLVGDELASTLQGMAKSILLIGAPSSASESAGEFTKAEDELFTVVAATGFSILTRAEERA